MTFVVRMNHTVCDVNHKNKKKIEIEKNHEVEICIFEKLDTRHEFSLIVSKEVLFYKWK